MTHFALAMASMLYDNLVNLDSKICWFIGFSSVVLVQDMLSPGERIILLKNFLLNGKILFDQISRISCYLLKNFLLKGLCQLKTS